MLVVRNKLNQRLVINLKGGRDIDLLANGSSEISSDDMDSPHLKNLLAKDSIVLIQTEENPEKKDATERKPSYGKKGRY